MSPPYDPKEASTARPAGRVDPRARGERRNRISEGAGNLPELPSLGEVERRLMRCDDELIELVEQHYDAAEQEAAAEADWKRHFDVICVEIADSGDKEAADIRESRARLRPVTPAKEHDDGTPVLGDDLFRTWQILKAHEKSIERQLKAVNTRAMTLASVAKGIREVS